MTQALRRTLSLAAIVTLLLTLFVGLGWWSIHTTWFANVLRSRIIATLSEATGGQVEIRSFSLNPENTHLRLTGVVIHGTEPAGARPLLSVDSAELDFTILSLWRPSVDLESLKIDHPEINLLINLDGSTNIPAPRHPEKTGPLQRLFDVKIKQLALRNGFLQLLNRRLPFHFESQNTNLLLDYNRVQAGYAVAFQTRIANMNLQQTSFRPLTIRLDGEVFRDHAEVRSLNLVTDHAASTITLKRTAIDFAQGTVDAGVEASLSIDELTQLPKIDDFLRDGRGSVWGNVHIDGRTGQFKFLGKATAQGVNFLTAPFSLRNIAGESDIVADNQGMLLLHAVAHARGARFWGEGSIKHYSLLAVDAHFAQLALKEVGSYLTKEAFPWSGTVQGIGHATAILTEPQPDFNIEAKADIEAGAYGIPTSGSVDVTYRLRTAKVDFGDSILHLPHSKVTFRGALDGNLSLAADTSSLTDFQPLIPILQAKIAHADLPGFAAGGRGHFEGALSDLIHQPLIKGNVALDNFQFRNYNFDSLMAQIAYSPSGVSISHLNLKETGASISGEASANLHNWQFDSEYPFQLSLRFSNLDVVKTAAMFNSMPLPLIRGVASGSINAQGTADEPRGQGSFGIANLDAYGQQVNKAQFDASLEGNQLRFSKGRVQSGPAVLAFSGGYRHSADNWSTGDVEISADTNGFPLASLSTVRKLAPGMDGRAELHLRAAGKLRTASFVPTTLNGSALFTNVSMSGNPIGNLSATASTAQGASIDFKYSGQLRDAKFEGAAQALLTNGTPIHGDLQLGRIGIGVLKGVVANTSPALPIDGYLDGKLSFSGPLEDPYQITAAATVKELQINAAPGALGNGRESNADLVFRNSRPILISFKNGEVDVDSFEIAGRDTNLVLAGSAQPLGDKQLNLKAYGTVDLALFALFDPNVRTSGISDLAASITGTYASPNVNGSLQLHNASLFFADLPNGLSDVNGSVIFGRNRAVVQKMSGHSGGGDVSLGGSISFGGGTPVVYQLQAAARNVRVRYANTISVTGNSDLKLSGTSGNSILSGVLTVSRVVFTPNADAGNLLAAAVAPSASPAEQGDFISGLHLDLTVESAPNLQVSTNLSRDVEAEIQLRLRGTPEHPIVLGTINANQGDLRIFGTRFSLNRGEVSFVNPVRIEPVLDLDLQTEARGVTVDITVSGTPSKLNFNYRSDPPLQPRDIIALLTVGRAPNVGATGNAQVGNDVSALSSGVNSVLGQAISPVSNRLSKLFGITNIKIDPFTQGITNTPQARLSVEQQVSRNVTVTYVTNLSQTSEQIFRFEWALTRQFSIVALRDDNGEFGIDFQIKKRFK